jgi:hypothetical protein
VAAGSEIPASERLALALDSGSPGSSGPGSADRAGAPLIPAAAASTSSR